MRSEESLLSSGMDGLDEILRGGSFRGGCTWSTDDPGPERRCSACTSSKGLEEGGTTLFIHGEESEEEILANGAAVGIDIGDSEFLDVGPDSDFFTEDYTYDLVEPSDLEEDR